MLFVGPPLPRVGEFEQDPCTFYLGISDCLLVNKVVVVVVVVVVDQRGADLSICARCRSGQLSSGSVL